MSVLPIVKWPDERLTETCAEITDITGEIQILAADMLETMYDAPGRGLAAPQIGKMIRLFVTDTTWINGDRAPMVFVNPSITGLSKETQSHEETCLSLPGVSVAVARPERVELTWTDLSGDEKRQIFEGDDAAVVQHELNHLDGKVTLDHLESEERARVLDAYEAKSA